jgi:hypothetical protein
VVRRALRLRRHGRPPQQLLVGHVVHDASRLEESYQPRLWFCRWWWWRRRRRQRHGRRQSRRRWWRWR